MITESIFCEEFSRFDEICRNNSEIEKKCYNNAIDQRNKYNLQQIDREKRE